MAFIVKRGRRRYRRQGGEPISEAEHFYRCKECGQLVDRRDLGMVFAHLGLRRIPKKRP
jgi:hypothetical protein